MRLITIILAVLLILIQYPLWFGKGGWWRVWHLDRQLTEVKKKNADLKAQNRMLESEVRDLKEGTDAIEERARHGMGMIKPNEQFVQILSPDKTSTPPASGKP